MIEWKNLTGPEIAQLDRRLPVIIPIGLVESHGPHLAVSVDCDTAEYFGRRLAQETGAILAPIVNYGFADELWEYPGTVGVTAETLVAIYTDLSLRFCAQGFTRQVWLSGHGGNKGPWEIALPRIWQGCPEARVAYWAYWTEAGLTGMHHADEQETGVALAVGTRAQMDRVVDCKLDKPWYRVRSRMAISPDTGGINGYPSRATREAGVKLCDDVVRILGGRLKAIIAAERAS